MESNNKKLRLTAEIVFDWHDGYLDRKKETATAVANKQKRKELATLKNDFAD